MTFEALLNEASALEPDERLRLIDALWDGMPDTESAAPLLDWQVTLLAERMRDLRENPGEGSPAQDVIMRLKDRLAPR